jgi:hypothetical protein
MFSTRYGDLTKIAAQTDGDCHLCCEPADLAMYGPTGAFGRETVTVDHLVPQILGGCDELDNLRLAHGHCNSARGLRGVEETRLRLGGRPDAPMSAGAKSVTALLVGGGAAIIAGTLLETDNARGEKEFNAGAALVTLLLVGFGVRALL